MPFDDATPSLGEVIRIIQDFRNEYRSSLPDLVRKDVYDSQQEALKLRVSELEAAAKSRQALLYGTIATAGLALFGWILSAVGAT